MAIPPVIEFVVKQGDGYCSGCGVCVGICPTQAIRMGWNELGMLEAVLGDSDCTLCNHCLTVCPFADGLAPNQINPNEDEIAKDLFDGVLGDYHPALGFYQECWVGHAPATRMLGSSGGLGTWFSVSLLKQGIVDKVISVAPVRENTPPYFQYTISSTPEEVLSCAKSRYYPVHVADVLELVKKEKARYAMVALPCVLKAIRLAQNADKVLREHIKFCIALFCSGAKTAFFLEYLVAQSGVGDYGIEMLDFRLKVKGIPSSDFVTSFRAQETKRDCLLRTSTIGDVWGTRFFVPNACDYCDDVMGELSDISLGDAWLPEYANDWQGTNLVIVRSDVARQLVSAGILQGELELVPISPPQIVESQAGNYRHRREGLAYRLHFAARAHRNVPRKRTRPLRFVFNPLKSRLYRQRMQVRELSHTAWLKQRETTGTELFDAEMQGPLRFLDLWSRIVSFPRLILSALSKQWARFWRRK